MAPLAPPPQHESNVVYNPFNAAGGFTGGQLPLHGKYLAEEVNSSLNQLSTYTQQLEIGLEHMNNRLSDFTLNNQKLSATVEQLQTDIIEKDAEHEIAIAQLRAEVTEKVKEDDFTISQLETNIDRKDKEHKAAFTQYGAEIETISKANECIMALKARVTKLEEELKEKEALIDELTDTKISLQGTVGTFKRKHDALDIELRKQRGLAEEVTQKKKELEIALTSAKEDIEALRGDKQDLSGEVELLEDAKFRLEQNKEAMFDASIDQQVLADAEIAKVWKEKAALQKNIDALHDELQEMKGNVSKNAEQSEVDELSVEAPTKPKNQSDIDRLNGIVNKVLADKTALTAQIQSLIADSQNNMIEKQSFISQITALEQENTKLFQKPGDSEGADPKSVYEEKIADLNHELEQCLNHSDTLSFQLHTAQQQINGYVREKSNTAGEQSRAAAETVKLRIKTSMLEYDKEELEKILAAAHGGPTYTGVYAPGGFYTDLVKGSSGGGGKP